MVSNEVINQVQLYVILLLPLIRWDSTLLFWCNLLPLRWKVMFRFVKSFVNHQVVWDIHRSSDKDILIALPLDDIHCFQAPWDCLILIYFLFCSVVVVLVDSKEAKLQRNSASKAKNYLLHSVLVYWSIISAMGLTVL